MKGLGDAILKGKNLIGKEAFAGHTELVKVEVPGYIESIDYNAFSGCSSLETIAIPDTVTSTAPPPADAVISFSSSSFCASSI